MDKKLKRTIGYKAPAKDVVTKKSSDKQAPPVPRPKEVKSFEQKVAEIGTPSASDLVESFTAKLDQVKKECDAKLEALGANNEKLKEEIRSLKDGPKMEPATAEEVISWINDHPMFKYSAMCEEIGMDKGRFCKILKAEKPSLKPEVVAKIQAVIKEYGFRAK